MNKSYKFDYNAETDTFCLNDTIEQCLIVISREQLENLIKYYNLHFDVDSILNN